MHDHDNRVCENIVYTHDTDFLLCGVVQEYQQVRAFEELLSSSGSGSDDTSDIDSSRSDSGAGHLQDMTDDEWNDIRGICDVVNMEAEVETHAESRARDVTAEVDPKSIARDIDIEKHFR